MNSLIIVAGASRARLFRIAKTAGSEESNELIQVDSIPDARSAIDDPAVAPPPDLAERVARRAAEFARYHLCNPVIVAAPPGTSERLLLELERQLPETYIRSIVRDLSGLEPAAVLQDLQHFLARPEPGTAPVA